MTQLATLTSPRKRNRTNFNPVTQCFVHAGTNVQTVTAGKQTTVALEIANPGLLLGIRTEALGMTP